MPLYPCLFLAQKMEEINPLEEPPDMEGEQILTLVNKAVTAITTRVQSKFSIRFDLNTLAKCFHFLPCVCEVSLAKCFHFLPRACEVSF